MKREFLQNFKVGDQPLPKDVIDARPNPKREYDRNVVRDKKIDKRKNFSGNSNDSFFLAQFRLMRPKPITKRIFTIFNRNPRNLTKNRFYVGIAGKNFL